MHMYESLFNTYEFINLIGSYYPCYNIPIHDLVTPPRSYLWSRSDYLTNIYTLILIKISWKNIVHNLYTLAQ